VRDHVTYYHLTCVCGHEAHVALSRWLHRDEIRRRAKCTACGSRQVREVRIVVDMVNTLINGPASGLEGLPVRRV